MLVQNTMQAIELESEADNGFLAVFRPGYRNGRRVLLVNHYNDAGNFLSWQKSRILGHHHWGCLELASMGYRVLLPPRCPAAGPISRHMVADWTIARWAARHLKSGDIVYCAHNLLRWAPLLKRLGRLRARLVGLLYATEPLWMARQYDGVLALTKVASAWGRQIAPQAKCLHIGWGFDLSHPLFAVKAFEPRWGLSCGVTHRDWSTLSEAYQQSDHPLRILCRGAKLPPMPAHVSLTREVASPQLMWDEYYRHASYSLVILRADARKRTAVGFTNILESMALGRPIIKTRTGAVDDDLDIEQEGIGLYVAPGDAESLRIAASRLWEDPAAARQMGENGRRLCETRYSMGDFGQRLHEFFSSL